MPGIAAFKIQVPPPPPFQKVILLFLLHRQETTIKKHKTNNPLEMERELSLNNNAIVIN
jgi:hypothetical protein